ncbi:enoyl-CoA hydratase/isomerase family protein [Rhodococcus sp. CSLK01-03]|uniref:Enoyl-CoA hydratase/isomerase family protein n=1 Tax=Rhodococcus indonesiensis TaxID=3055869 RepID=A0ABT7RNY5_9NOCA|nr:enoyl-CoA hydratase/isomerase family protein [Rhodococcus indonesiensis]MDM7489349.1 enoyl-CoA hydratase/isomerase family protein [Rhodococcus indonesiensis]
MPSSDAVLLETPSDGVRLITLNRARIRNAITLELTEAYREVLDDVSTDDSVRAVVITGAGSSFCAGADLSWLDIGNSASGTPDRIRSKLRSTYDTWLTPRKLSMPVVAAINGPAIGAGVCVALACDLRYCSTDSVLSTPFLHLGTHGGMGVTHLLPDAVGVTRAREMLYTGRTVSAATAVEWGLVNGAHDDVVEHSIDVATRIAEAAPIATRFTKTGLDRSRHDLEAAVEWELLAQPVTMATQDIHEGIAAKRQGRRPAFRGN